ncbi:MAG: hypothetical protein KC964_31330 [Candidatus Omnitrophica bacterium]|nr:hypothetical protein [Candidatus Omnitrophota bacterium]
MKPIQSPLEIGDIRWYDHCLEVGFPWNRYRSSVKRQVHERGSVPPEVWETDDRRLNARKIEQLICDHCWGEPLQFHPDDPWAVIGEVEAGDLSEIELLVDIEETLKIKLLPDRMFGALLKSGWTFGDMVTYIEGKSASCSQGDTSKDSSLS